MTPAFVVVCRDKEKHVRMACESVLAQTYPCHVVLSDQGSVDRSPDIMHELAATYRGHHKVSVVECPVTDQKGMSGMNAHMDWLFQEVEEELIIATTADDWAHPQRAEKVIKAFEETGADYVCTGMVFTGEDGNFNNAVPTEQGWVRPEEVLMNRVGGSTSMALRKSFYERIAPMQGVVCNAIYLPFLASLFKGCYYVHELLQQYIRHVDPDNTGLGGQFLAADAAADEAKQKQLTELQHYQFSATWYALIEKMKDLKLGNDDL